MLYDEDGRKTPKYKNECENQGKIPSLIAIPSLLWVTPSDALIDVYLGKIASPLCRWRCPWCNGHRRRIWTRDTSSNPGQD